MKPATAEGLVRLNRSFYQTFAVHFSQTRGRIQPGVARALASPGWIEALLDLGCGNGGLAAWLIRRGWRGTYLGIDSSPELVAIARGEAGRHNRIQFQVADLLDLDLAQTQAAEFNCVAAFAVLHHIPGADRRRHVVHTIRQLLRPGGTVWISVWNFLASPRLRARIQPWDRIGLTPADVDPGDYLLDWRRGGTGLRYIHAFSPSEMESLAAQAGFRVVETFFSDGQAGRLGLYQQWADGSSDGGL
jgi:tRNA (uracil-5-)-methyltransferase TRM9